MSAPERDALVRELLTRYQPAALLVYGSFADGTQDQYSDFDALAIVRQPSFAHDHRIFNGRRLDVFFAAPEEFEDPDVCEDWPQLAHAEAVYDPSGFGASLIARVRAWYESRPRRPRAACEQDVAWCEKMTERALRGGEEGFYRWHWLLTESLQILLEVEGTVYFGPKKALRWLREHDPEAYVCYGNALTQMTPAALQNWTVLLRTRLESQKFL